MKVALLNSVLYGSTGKICRGLSKLLADDGQEAHVFYGRGDAPVNVPSTRTSGAVSIYAHVALSRAFDRAGFGSARETRRLVRALKSFDPDVIHLHNLHGYWLHLPTLFAYLQNCGKPVVWTLHDCWAFTGHCAYFDEVACEKWRAGCGACPARHAYPKSYFADSSARNFEDKRRMFAAVPHLTLVTPSDWLKGLVGQSFLKDYPVCVFPNGVDQTVFCPTKSDLAAQYGLAGKHVLLGVANVWEKRKGLETFLELRRRMDDGTAIVLIGLSEAQRRAMPQGILGLARTQNAGELAAWYTLADVLVDATREENFPTTHLEALSCGTPVATFCAGGSAEMLTEKCGFGVPVGDVDGLLRAIDDAAACTAADCLAQSVQYDQQRCFGAYIALYQKLCKGENA